MSDCTPGCVLTVPTQPSVASLQAAFKRAPASSFGTGAADKALTVEWDKVKPEDKTLAHQVCA